MWDSLDQVGLWACPTGIVLSLRVKVEGMALVGGSIP